jgi:hypothetical protein
MWGHLPERASEVMVPAAVRRGGRLEGERREGITTKPSRRREVRWGVEGVLPFWWDICLVLWLLDYLLLGY